MIAQLLLNFCFCLFLIKPVFTLPLTSASASADLTTPSLNELNRELPAESKQLASIDDSEYPEEHTESTQAAGEKEIRNLKYLIIKPHRKRPTKRPTPAEFD